MTASSKEMIVCKVEVHMTGKSSSMQKCLK